MRKDIIMDFIVYLIALVFISYILLIFCALISMRTRQRITDKAVRERGIRDSSGRFYYVIPWPEADEKSWVEYMKKEEYHTVINSSPYWEEWTKYKDEHPKSDTR